MIIKEVYYNMNKKDIAIESIEIAGKTVLSAIPIGGTLITSVWDSVKSHSAQKRLDEWKEAIEVRLQNVEHSLDEIGDNEIFTSTLIKATEVAIRTADLDKRTYLANAVYNSINVSAEESVIMIYLNMLEEYTAWHLKILHYFQNPTSMIKAELNYCTGSAMQPLLSTFPEMADKKNLVKKIIDDMQADGLLVKGSYIGTTMTAQGMVAKRTTEFGDEFLKFIL